MMYGFITGWVVDNRSHHTEGDDNARGGGTN